MGVRRRIKKQYGRIACLYDQDFLVRKTQFLTGRLPPSKVKSLPSTAHKSEELVIRLWVRNLDSWLARWWHPWTRVSHWCVQVTEANYLISMLYIAKVSRSKIPTTSFLSPKEKQHLVK